LATCFWVVVTQSPALVCLPCCTWPSMRSSRWLLTLAMLLMLNVNACFCPALRRCLELSPDSRNAGQNRLLALNYIHRGEMALVCEAHAEWGERFQHLFTPLAPLAGLSRSRDRPLRVRGLAGSVRMCVCMCVCMCACVCACMCVCLCGGPCVEGRVLLRSAGCITCGLLCCQHSAAMAATALLRCHSHTSSRCALLPPTCTAAAHLHCCRPPALLPPTCSHTAVLHLMPAAHMHCLSSHSHTHPTHIHTLLTYTPLRRTAHRWATSRPTSSPTRCHTSRRRR
jgi:hypothetical protein